MVIAHEPEPFAGIAFVSRANQAAAFERISRSSLSRRFSRRRRLSSSRSAVVRPPSPRQHLAPHARAAIDRNGGPSVLLAFVQNRKDVAAAPGRQHLKMRSTTQPNSIAAAAEQQAHAGGEANKGPHCSFLTPVLARFAPHARRPGSPQRRDTDATPPATCALQSSVAAAEVARVAACASSHDRRRHRSA